MSQNHPLNNLFNEDVEQKSDILFRQYQLYVEMADHISSRRAIANAFYLTATSILVAVMGIIVQAQLFIYVIPFSIIGIIIAVFWIFLIWQYKNLNGAKFQVINKIEEKLPVKGYSTEWDLLSQGRKRRIYWPLTHVEILVPSFLILVSIFLLAISIWYLIPY